jgi:hypothetical protein
MSTVEDAIEDNLTILQHTLQKGPVYFKKAFRVLDNQQDAVLNDLINPDYRDSISEAIRHPLFTPMNGIFTDPRALHYNINTSGGNQVELVQNAHRNYHSAMHMLDGSPLQRLGIPEGVADMLSK